MHQSNILAGHFKQEPCKTTKNVIFEVPYTFPFLNIN